MWIVGGFDKKRIFVEEFATFLAVTRSVSHRAHPRGERGLPIGGVSLEKLVGQKVILANVFCANTTKIDL